MSQCLNVCLRNGPAQIYLELVHAQYLCSPKAVNDMLATTRELLDLVAIRMTCQFFHPPVTTTQKQLIVVVSGGRRIQHVSMSASEIDHLGLVRNQYIPNIVYIPHSPKAVNDTCIQMMIIDESQAGINFSALQIRLQSDGSMATYPGGRPRRYYHLDF